MKKFVYFAEDSESTKSFSDEEIYLFKQKSIKESIEKLMLKVSIIGILNLVGEI